MAEVKDARLECSSCKKQVVISGFDPSQRYPCPDCLQIMMTPSQAGGTVIRPSAEETLPAEVQQALKHPSRRIGRFILVSEIGEGGMGLVYKAWDEGLSRWVAIKFIRPEGGSEGDVARFKREAKLAAGLDHPNIAPIYEVGEVDTPAFGAAPAGKKNYIVMKFIEGKTLDRSGIKDLGGLVAAVREACRGVGFAHQNGIIHRDLKPKNIMIDASGRVYVMDFGLAKSLGLPGMTFTDARLGTPTYMSPEQARGNNKDLDPRCDVYSLGVTLWELLAGRPPHAASSILDMIVKVATEPIPSIRNLRPDVPESFDGVLCKATAMEKSERYATAAELGEALDGCLSSEGTRLRAIRPATPAPAIFLRPAPPRSRRVWILTISSVAIVALFVLAGFGLFFRRAERARSREEQAKSSQTEADSAKKNLLEIQYRRSMDKARQAEKAGRWEDALDAYLEATGAKPEDPEALAGQKAMQVKTHSPLLPVRLLMGDKQWCRAHEALRRIEPRLLFDTEHASEEARELAATCISQGTRIVFTSNRDGHDEIYVMKPDGSGLRRLTDHPGGNAWPVWSPDGRKIAFTSSRENKREIYVMSADGTGQKRLTEGTGADDDPSWSPDGKKIAYKSYTASEAAEIWVMSSNGGDSRPLTKTGGMNGWPVWSPDGAKLAYFSKRDEHLEIFVMNGDGSGQSRLTQSAFDNTNPAWSPDGRRIAFQSRPEKKYYKIFVMNADGSGQSQLTVTPSLDGLPVWSPDGKKIAFHSNRDGNLEIYVMNSDGTGQMRLTRTTADNSGPSWSPDGRRVTFTSTRDGNREIYVMNADGTGQTRLTDHPASDANPRWSAIVDE